MKKSCSIPAEDRALLRSVERLAVCEARELYIVGGYIRDLLLGRTKDTKDIDLCVSKGAIPLGRKLARKLNAGFVILDDEHGCCRLVVKRDETTYTIDITDFKGETLDEDLLHRDFTMNAVAVALSRAVREENIVPFLVDPRLGLRDLAARTIKTVSAQSIPEDPVRLLRAFSFSCMLDFTIDPATLKQARKERLKLLSVSYERIRDEIFKILSTSRAGYIFQLLDAQKILEIIFPQINPMRKIGQGPYHHLDVWQHTIETIKQLEQLLDAVRDPRMEAYLNCVLSADRKRFALLKFAAFLHDFGKPPTRRRQKGRTTFHGHERVGMRMAGEIGRVLKLSRDEVHSLQKIVLWHLRPGYLADIKTLSPRAVFRFFRDTSPESLGVLLLSIADQRSTKGPLNDRVSRIHHEKVALGLVKEYFRKEKSVRPVRLLTGHDIMKTFKLAPSPLVGEILKELEELQAIGKISDKKTALKAAERLVKKA